MSEPKRETLYYRVRGGLTGDMGVSNECRVIRGVTSLRDRGFRTFRNGREPLNNTRDSKTLDFMTFVNAVVSQAKEIPWMVPVLASYTMNMGNVKYIATKRRHFPIQGIVGHTTGGVEPPYSPSYIRGIVGHTTDEVVHSSSSSSWSFTVGCDGEVDPDDTDPDEVQDVPFPLGA